MFLINFSHNYNDMIEKSGGFFGNFCNCSGIRIASRSSKGLLMLSAIGLSGGSSEDFEEVSLSEDSSDEDGDEGGGVGGVTPTS